MKSLSLVILMPCVSLLVAGCGGDSHDVPDTVEDAPLQKAFQDASPEVRKQIDQANQAIEDDRYAEAFQIMEKVGASTQLAPEEKEAMFETITQMKKVMDWHPRIGTKEAYAAMEELIGTLDPEYGRRRQTTPLDE